MATITAARPKPLRNLQKDGRSWPGQLFNAIILTLAARLAYSVYAIWRLTSLAKPYVPAFHGNWQSLQLKSTSPLYIWVAPWEHLDALWYKEIATAGYGSFNGTVHFPPLLSVLSHLLMPVVDNSFGLAAMAINFVACILAFFLLQRLSVFEGLGDDGARAALYMCAYPVGFYLFAPFTEATFLLLTVASLYFARTQRWWLAGVAGFFATLSRWQGALLSPALLFEYALQVRSGKRRAGPEALSVLLPGLAYLLFTLYARVIVGEPLSMTQLNRLWGIRWLPPWQVLGMGWSFILRHGSGLETLNLAAIALLGITTVIAIRYMHLTYVVYAALQFLFITAHVSQVSPLASASRYVLPLFPAFLVLGHLGANTRVHQVLLIFMFLLQGIWLWQFVAGEWVA